MPGRLCRTAAHFLFFPKGTSALIRSWTGSNARYYPHADASKRPRCALLVGLATILTSLETIRNRYVLLLLALGDAVRRVENKVVKLCWRDRVEHDFISARDGDQNLPGCG